MAESEELPSGVAFPCQFFREMGPEWSSMCTRKTKRRPEFSMNMFMCDIHVEALTQDPEDWSYEVMRDMRKDHFILTHNNGDQYDGRRCVGMPELDMGNPWRIIKDEHGKEHPPRHMGCVLHHGISFDPPSFSREIQIEETFDYGPDGVKRTTKRSDGSWETIYIPREVVEEMWEELKELVQDKKEGE